LNTKEGQKAIILSKLRERKYKEELARREEELARRQQELQREKEIQEELKALENTNSTMLNF
jgi:hypothetical protein